MLAEMAGIKSDSVNAIVDELAKSAILFDTFGGILIQLLCAERAIIAKQGRLPVAGWSRIGGTSGAEACR